MGKSGITCDIEYQYVVADNDTFVIGATANSRMHFGIYNNVWMFGCGDNYINTGARNTDWNVAHLVWDTTSSMTVNGTTTSRSASAWDNNTPLALFARDVNGYGKSKARIKVCNIRDGSTLVRRYIPCVRTGDNAAGLYDAVNESFVLLT